MLFETEIKAALKKAGLAESLFDQITVKEVNEIEGKVAALKSDMDKVKNLSADEFFAAVKSAGLEDSFKKVLQSETDRRVTEAIKTHETNLKKAADDAEKKKQDDSAKVTLTPEQKKIAALEDTVKALNEKLDGITTTITTGDMSSKIRAELKKQGLSEKFEGNIAVTDSAKIAEAVTGFKANFDEQQQAVIDKKLADGELSPVKRGAAGQTFEESTIAAYASSKGVGGAVKNPDFPGKISAGQEPAKAETTKE